MQGAGKASGTMQGWQASIRAFITKMSHDSSKGHTTPVRPDIADRDNDRSDASRRTTTVRDDAMPMAWRPVGTAQSGADMASWFEGPRTGEFATTGSERDDVNASARIPTSTAQSGANQATGHASSRTIPYGCVCQSNP